MYIQVAFGSSATCDLVGDWAEVCPGKCLLTGQTGSEMSFVRCKWGFLRDYRCKVEGLMSINYLELCDFVKYVL